MKEKTRFICGECGYEAPRWMGKCPSCNSWNTLFEEERISVRSASGGTAKAVPLSAVQEHAQKRIEVGIGELDRVLGGGAVMGMVILLAGDPGIGKSTLLLQVAENLDKSGTVLYVSGEESRSQIKHRAKRIGVETDLLLLSETSVEAILDEARNTKCRHLIVDSIQTMRSETADSAQGSVTQVRTATAILTQYAKETGTTVWIVGHVTKEGAIAGPRVLEHIVDTVLYFEGDRHEGLRMLRTVKNRFGSTNELGIFEMCDSGMKEVKDPSHLFVTGSRQAGCAVTCVLEGSRPLLAEVQALICPTVFGSSRRTAIGLEQSRLHLLLAVLERKCRLKLSDKDVYLDVAGNLRVLDRAADLAVAMCLASTLLDKPLSEQTVFLGEVGLTGELRPVPQLDLRIRECVRLGYTHIVLPSRAKTHETGFEALRVPDLAAAIRLGLKLE